MRSAIPKQTHAECVALLSDSAVTAFDTPHTLTRVVRLPNSVPEAFVIGVVDAKAKVVLDYELYSRADVAAAVEQRRAEEYFDDLFALKAARAVARVLEA